MADQKHIMAIGAHIGDMELTAGMLLAKHAMRGDKITTVALTAGERGAPPKFTVPDFRKIQVESAQKFAKTLGGESIVLDYCDGELPENEKIKFEICDIIRKAKPDLIITHWSKSMHKDHMTAHKVTVDGHFYAALATMERELPPQWAKGPLFAQNWEDAESFNPYVYIDVSGCFDLWEKAVRNLWLSTNSSFPYLQYYDSLTRANGILIGKERAEAFAVPYEKMRVVADYADDLNI